MPRPDAGVPGAARRLKVDFICLGVVGRDASAKSVARKVFGLHARVPGGIDESQRIRVCVEVAMKARRILSLAQIAVLGDESADFGVEVAGLANRRSFRD